MLINPCVRYEVILRANRMVTTTSVFIFCERLAIRNNHVRKKRTTMESIGFTASTPGQKLIRT